MYLVCFNRKDEKPREEYYYGTEAEAMHHASLFDDDDSNLYKNIVVSDETENKVLKVILFDDDGTATCFKDGDIVRLHPDFSSEAERRYLYVLKNINDRMMRGQIVCLNLNMAIPSAETVGLNMIVPTKLGKEDILNAYNNASL